MSKPDTLMVEPYFALARPVTTTSASNRAPRAATAFVSSLMVASSTSRLVSFDVVPLSISLMPFLRKKSSIIDWTTPPSLTSKTGPSALYRVASTIAMITRGLFSWLIVCAIVAQASSNFFVETCTRQLARVISPSSLMLNTLCSMT